MPLIKTDFDGLLIFEPKVIEDDRGYFYESYNRRMYEDEGYQYDWVQDNQAFSSRGVVRGLHYQTGDMAQAKLVRVIEGEVLDVVVDIRPGSPTYGKSYSIILNAENKKQLLVPRGFAHGYAVLSDTAIFFYKCDNYYSKEHEGGILFNDPQLKIDWLLTESEIQLSEKDKVQPVFNKHRPFFTETK
ncbi:MAG TPA: dTDP-4-dehydrorhamnose 3,5-epimerase [Saprospiraceae bacterium]|nr:dTDP-4-dehydrorhamnose 3,5-epimerase [Saprospiraceae bacterium]HMV24484.1 dTDP-4-dehydrorhamnose 3,5-epimerase [Saprospiraceae bacterium]HMZ74424.1 dTDP-4-dehydrorhamnose 3,5-epimerase [Saprospiraceae bacterium]HNG06279.1 dTDP-4-dehydrorhamnose 3,5-epimerase [Saprospiraceae bacterium]HNG13404.1 dTDP-4-dehydrorhamnose 3,5-epimerase [Saprospiraceae bacterium]